MDDTLMGGETHEDAAPEALTAAATAWDDKAGWDEEEGVVGGDGAPRLLRGTANVTAPLAVPGGGRAGSSRLLAASAPQQAMSSSYDSAGAGFADCASSSYRCGTALRFYRSSSSNALRGMLEAAVQQQQQQLLWQEQQGLTAAFVASSSAQQQWAQGRRSSVAGSVVESMPNGAALGVQGQGSGPRPGVLRGVKANGSAGPAKASQLVPGGGQQRSTWPFLIYAVSIVVCMAGSLAVWPGVTAFICGAGNPATVSPCAPRGQYGEPLALPAAVCGAHAASSLRALCIPFRCAPSIGMSSSDALPIVANHIGRQVDPCLHFTTPSTRSTPTLHFQVAGMVIFLCQ
jgi:hypothetical protein